MNKQELITQYALSFLGTPYNFGGANKLTGLDCSQLVLEILIAAGEWKHGQDTTAQGLYNHFLLKSNLSGSKWGALSFYGKSIKEISHVGFLLSNQIMIEAGGGTSTTKNLDEAKKRSALVRLRPYNFRSDLVAVLNPEYDFVIE